MQNLNPETLLSGKQEDARIQIAERVGDSLSVDDLATADRRAAELLARALPSSKRVWQCYPDEASNMSEAS